MSRKKSDKLKEEGLAPVVNEAGPTGLGVKRSDDFSFSSENVDKGESNETNSTKTRARSRKPKESKDTAIVAKVSTVTESDIKTYLDEWEGKKKNSFPLESGEKKKFLAVCKEYGFNPLRDEIFLVETGNPFRPGVVSRQAAIGFNVFMERVHRVSGVKDTTRYTFKVERKENPISGQMDAMGTSTFYLNQNEYPGQAPTSIGMEFWYSNFKRDSEYHRKMPNLVFMRVCFCIHSRMLFPAELAKLPLTVEEITEPKFTASATLRPNKKSTPPPPVPPPAAPPLVKESAPVEESHSVDQVSEKKQFDIPYVKNGEVDQCSKTKHEEMVNLINRYVHVINDEHIRKFGELLKEGISENKADQVQKFLISRTMHVDKIYNMAEGKLKGLLVEPVKSKEVSSKICKYFWMIREEDIVDLAENGPSVDIIRNAMKEVGLSLMLLKK